MIAIPLIVMTLFLVLMGVLIGLAVRTARTTRSDLPSWAAARGWTHRMRDPVLASTLVDVEDLWKVRQATDVVSGEHDGRSVTAFQVAVERRPVTVLVTDVSDLAGPRLSVLPRGPLASAFGRPDDADVVPEPDLLGADVEVTAGPDSRAAERARAVLTEPVQRALVPRSSLDPVTGWWLDGERLVVVRQGAASGAVVTELLGVLDVVLDGVRSAARSDS